MGKRVFWIVLDSAGIGGAPDAAEFGDFGADTEKALLDFQRHYGLEADGVCGPATWACLLGVRK